MDQDIRVLIVGATDNPVPAYETMDSAGMDLRAHLEAALEIDPGQRVLVPTGLHLEIPRGYEGQVRPRSGLALKHGLTVLNAPGTIDADYRGEVGVILINHSSETQRVAHGDRIAQLVIAPVVQAELLVVDKLADSDRGTGGFGSTGGR
jgi:dUTP pyrophosphatase